MTTTAARPAETVLRLCRTCGQTKPLAAFWLAGGTYRRHVCSTCDNTRQNQEDRRAVWITNAQRIALRRLQRQIPEPSYKVELEVVLACWNDCVAVGDTAIDRMMTRLAKVAQLADDRMKAELLMTVRSFRRGGLSLEAARQRVARVGG